MCGIVGYNGKEQAAPIILSGLARLEYRGYDSAGIAINDGKNIKVEKTPGRLKILSELTHDGATLPGTAGIGHTRWATHGAPTKVNAHPQANTAGTIMVVHNGIIENYLKIKNRLASKGYEFKSETDTEVVAQLLDYYYDGDPLRTISRMISRVEGSYAFGIMFAEYPDVIYAARKNSPLIVGSSEEGNFIASDVPAILKYTRSVYYPDNDEICVLRKDGVEFYNNDLDPLTKELHTIEWDIEAAEKGGYEHFMLKEIHEQPQAVKNTLNPHIENGRVLLDELDMTDEEIRAINSIQIVACGSASYVGMCARYAIEGIAKIPTYLDVASEFRYRDPILHENDLVIIISQSGETADSLQAIRICKEKGVRTLAVVNVFGSSIAREADRVIYTNAGPEIAVATTKAFSTQLIILDLLALRLGRARGVISDSQEVELVNTLKEIPANIEMLISNERRIQKFATRFAAAEDVFYIGRGIDYALSMEGALKLKEISYIHSEAYAAGELKHGTISLVEDNTLVVSLLTQPDLVQKTISNLVEVKARGAFVMAVTTEDNTQVEKVADYVIYIPKVYKYFTPSLSLIPLQMFAYYVAVGRGCDIDKPRNLAKSVTVE
ncbi:MAG: glutamine--fructose-6-phosphate transaminase (isomerizing) [Eubacterium sp.]|nr:glutamine--fructose-6-phosphate transaminase (isomerizing) [Eubacterium sp.]